MTKFDSMTNKIIITSLFLGLSAASYSQNNKYVDKANLAYQSEQYCEAAEACALAYTKLTRKGKSAQKMKATMAFQTAESYRQTERYRLANEWYDRAILLDYQEIDPVVHYYNGEMFRIMGEKDKAIKQYTAFNKLAPGDTRGQVGIASCNKVEDFVANKTKHIVEPQKNINTKQFDMAPMFGDRKESVMYFGSSREKSTGSAKDPRTCEKYMDLWVSEMDKKGNWLEPKQVQGTGINTEDNEGTCAFDGRGKTMFFTRCPNVKKQNLGCDIWVAEQKSKTEWKEPTKLNLKTNDTLTVGHPCVSDDGKFLIFTSDLPGGFGGRDLWSTTYDKKSDSWTTPVNLGPEINTPGNDMFATFGKDGALYYATDGKPGMGGLDIFKAEKVGEQNKWQNAVNVGVPINSIHNDYALVEHTETRGYFTSERKSENGENIPDIWSYEMPPNLFDLKVIVANAKDKKIKIEDARVVVKSSTGDTWEGYTNAAGTVFWDKKPNGDRYITPDASYTVNVSKEGFYENKTGSKFTTIGLSQGQNFVVEMNLLPIEKVIRLPEVRYETSKWDLLVDGTINSPDSLLFVYNLLEEYPGMVLELSSHTDSRGATNANQVLSENRAHKCYEYLVKEKGVDPRRIVPVGKGENDPRTVYKKDGDYVASTALDKNGNPIDKSYSPVKLTEALINSFKTSNPAMFDKLHQFNRRTEGRVLNMDFNPATAPAAPKEYLEFKTVPKM